MTKNPSPKKQYPETNRQRKPKWPAEKKRHSRLLITKTIPFSITVQWHFTFLGRAKSYEVLGRMGREETLGAATGMSNGTAILESRALASGPDRLTELLSCTSLRDTLAQTHGKVIKTFLASSFMETVS